MKIDGNLCFVYRKVSVFIITWERRRHRNRSETTHNSIFFERLNWLWIAVYKMFELPDVCRRYGLGNIILVIRTTHLHLKLTKRWKTLHTTPWCMNMCSHASYMLQRAHFISKQFPNTEQHKINQFFVFSQAKTTTAQMCVHRIFQVCHPRIYSEICASYLVLWIWSYTHYLTVCCVEPIWRWFIFSIPIRINDFRFTKKCECARVRVRTHIDHSERGERYRRETTKIIFELNKIEKIARHRHIELAQVTVQNQTKHSQPAALNCKYTFPSRASCAQSNRSHNRTHFSFSFVCLFSRSSKVYCSP